MSSDSTPIFSLAYSLYTILCYNAITKPLRNYKEWLFFVFFCYFEVIRCLTASKATTPVATEALREFTVPRTGILTIKSQSSLVSLPIPKPSEPTTIAIAPLRSCS